LGTMNPIREIAERAHAVGALVLVDAAQSAPHIPLDVRALGVDFLAFSGHKTLGPMGIGALWGRPELLEKMPPALGGGEMIREVHTDRVAYASTPAKFEAGTPNVGGAVALSAALDYLSGVGWEEIAQHEHRLLDLAIRGARDRFGDSISVVGPSDPRSHHAVMSFRLSGVHPHDVAEVLDRQGVCVRAGHHCAQPLMERLQVPALTRASPYLYNTESEIGTFLDGLSEVARVFQVPVPVRAAS
jgi:cysteine desulfurase / selenocysteine lyase